MPHLSLSFLGGFSVALDTRPVTAFGSEKVRALLAFLAIEAANAHRRTEITAMLWPDSSEKKAAHNLSQSLLRLRQALREKDYPQNTSFLSTTPQEVQFRYWGDCQLDVTRFRELLHLVNQHVHAAGIPCEVCAKWLAQAAELYRGDLLAGLFVADSVAFEEWRVFQQEKLHGQALEVFTRLADYHERRGEFDRVQGYARRLISLEPWLEAAHLQMMRALMQSGQHNAALRQYEIYKRTLSEAFNIRPSAELSQIYKQISTGELTVTDPLPSKGGESPWLSRHGERKQVTALVCSLGTELDPERLEDQVLVCERYCENIFHRFGGRRVLRHGGACLTYFGYPQAYEDAARRAVHSGLAVVATLKDNGYEHVRIGIHTGMMMIGEPRGRNIMDRDLVGNTPDLARDCQRSAPVGTVIITEATQQLLRETFEVQPLETLLKGIGETLALFRVRGEMNTPGRLDWLAQTQRLTPFIGREGELSHLKSLLEKVRQGQGQVVLVNGESGIGKSRLIWELKEYVLRQDADNANAPGHPPFMWLTTKCLPHYQNTSLYPLIDLLETMLQFQPEDGGAARREKLASSLTRNGLNHPSTLWLLSIFLNLPTGTPAPETITQPQREQIRQLLVALLQKGTTEQPLALVIEDLHWSDPTTVDWIGQSLASLVSVPCLVLMTARPEFKPPWRLPHTVPLHLRALTPLWREQALQIVTNLAGETFLDEETRQHIVTQTDGIPLFIEELTKSLLERPALKQTFQKDTAIPPTLLDSLTARLDHLGLAKETAQWASVQGREFSYSLLRACTRFDEARLQADLARLIEAELVSSLHSSPQSEQSEVIERYLFRHALVQEAAYTSLLKRTRQGYHRRVAEIIETRFAQTVETQPEVLAEQYAAAGLPKQAIFYWLKAGERATFLGATLEAKNFFERALNLIAPDNLQQLWQALLGREVVLNFRGEREAQKADIDTLFTLAETHNNDEWRALVSIRRARYASSLADYPGQLEAAEAAIMAATHANSPATRALEGEALAFKITALLRLDERVAAKETVEKTLARIPQIKDKPIQAYASAAVALFYVDSGDPARAIQFLNQSLDAASHSPTRHLDLESQYYGHLGFAYIQLGLYPEARKALETGLELAYLMGIGRYQAYHHINLGFVHWRLGNLDIAAQMELQALQEYFTTGEVFGQAVCHTYLGYIYETARKWALALEHLAKARTMYVDLGIALDRIEVQAGEARIALEQDRLHDASSFVREIWQYLCENGTEGFSFPARVYLSVVDVLDVIRVKGIRLEEVLEAGYREVMTKADTILDASWRKSFLENIPENYRLMARYERQHAAG